MYMWQVGRGIFRRYTEWFVWGDMHLKLLFIN